jgi:hypothetical protein
MEIENYGAHCDFLSCHQKDFLPFKCNFCSKSLCLTHRSYEAHNCLGANAKEITSIDCPVCGKSVKYSKTEDPNRVFELHSSQSCSQIYNSSIKQVKKCCKSTCITIIGPSNSLVCAKCRKDVCLAHRVPEDHNCESLTVQNKFLDKFSKTKDSSYNNNNNNNSINNNSNNNSSIKNNNNNNISSIQNNSNNNGSSNNKQIQKKDIVKKQIKNNKNITDNSNSLKGTAIRRMNENDIQTRKQNTETITTIKPIVDDNIIHNNNKNTTYNNHNNKHNDKNNTFISNSNKVNDGDKNVNELCPFCFENFQTILLLQRHVEEFHQDNSNNDNISSNNSSSIQHINKNNEISNLKNLNNTGNEVYFINICFLFIFFSALYMCL